MSKVRLDLDHVLKSGRRILGRHASRHDDPVARSPVGRRRDGIAVGGLEGVEDSHDLVEVAASSL